MELILLGPPGAGKGTQAEKLVKKYDIPPISTGDIFRAAIKEGTELGRKAKEYMDKGLLVPDQVVVGIVTARLQEGNCLKGFLLDGFPRTVSQAEALDRFLSEKGRAVTAVINIEVGMEELIARLTGRRVCRNCGATYHLKFNPPKVRNVCNKCAGELYQREDDTVDTVKERLRVYQENTQPLINYYSNKGLLVNIDGSKEVEKVFDSIVTALEGS